MFISQKCRYALHAIFELAIYDGQGSVTIAEIAETQAILPWFLEAINFKKIGLIIPQRGDVGKCAISYHT